MLRQIFEPAPPPDPDAPPSPLWQRLGWFAALTLASGLVVIVTAYALRGLLFLE